MSFANKLIADKGHLIHKFRAKDATGRMAYYFVLIEKHKERFFQQALQSSQAMIDFTDFGKVIASCYGEKPTDLIQTYLRNTYGF